MYLNSPESPDQMDWHAHFPNHVPKSSEIQKMSKEEKDKIPKVSYIDVGCGFGGLLIELSKLWPDKLGLGMEIREKAVEFVRKRINKLQIDSQKAMEKNPNINHNNQEHKQNENITNHKYDNISVIHTNVMKYITHYFEKQSLDCLFFCFPDPHFKKSNFRRRIISSLLLDYYAYLLKDGGLIYNVTDVKELYEWTVSQFDKHPLFQRLTENQVKLLPAVDLISNKTDEAQRVTRNNWNKHVCVYRRLSVNEIISNNINC